MPTSKIPWAGAEGQTPEALNFLTWNCNKVSQGCKHCYAQAHSLKYPQNSVGGEFIGTPQFRPQSLDELYTTKSGTVLFVNTHSDTFHDKLPTSTIRKMFQHMNQRPDLIFLLLTKRPLNAWLLKNDLHWTDNIWLGTSIESMDVYQNRLINLLGTPAQHYFISFEPLLSGIEPTDDLARVHWIIAGGESGEYRRPFMKQWALDLQRFSVRHHIPFYFKQGSSLYPDQDRELDGQTYSQRPAAFQQLRDKYQVKIDQPTLF